MDFSSMSGWDFERYCADCLLKKGFTKAEVTSGSGDHGVDIIAEQNGIRFGIQCKLYQGQIPNKAVQEAYTGASYYDCDVAVIMSNSELTKQAQVEAKKLRVKFWSIVDYMPEEDKKSSKGSSAYKKNSEPTSYEEYVQNQKDYEHELSKKIKDELREQESHAPSDELLPELKALQHHEFKSAWIWLDPQNFKNETWYPFIQTIEGYLSDLKELDMQSLGGKEILLEKLTYVSRLCAFINVIGGGLQSTLWDTGVDASRFLGVASVRPSEINQLYWKACYLFEQEQIVFLKIKEVIESFSSDERNEIEKSSEDQELRGIEDELCEYKNALSHLEELWNAMPEKEETSRQDFSFWNDDSAIAEQIRKNKNTVTEIRNRVINYKEFQLKQQRERERQEEILKRKKKTIAKLIEQYRLDLKQLDAKKEKVLSNKREINREQIQQAQFQIDEYLRQKNSFALFRKKRDAELDEKISVLTRHISQLRESLPCELEEYEQEIQTERSKLLEEVLSTADKEGVLEEVKAVL
jgi:hypothetical protein